MRAQQRGARRPAGGELAGPAVSRVRYAGWLAFCFLAGPAPVAMAAVFYWIHCGELELLDWLILAQAGVFVVGYLLFALLAVAGGQHTSRANPVRIAQLVHGLGYRSAVLIALASLLSFENGRYLLFAIGLAHENVAGAWFLLTMYWLSALACATFVLRLAGWWSFRHIAPRCRPTRSAASPAQTVTTVTAAD
jgi:hypothetical protein